MLKKWGTWRSFYKIMTPQHGCQCEKGARASMAHTHVQDIKSSILILISDSIQLIITGCTNWGTSGMSNPENTACSKTPSLCSRNRIQEQNADAPSIWPPEPPFAVSRTQDYQRNTICTHQVQEVNISMQHTVKLWCRVLNRQRVWTCWKCGPVLNVFCLYCVNWNEWIKSLIKIN